MSNVSLLIDIFLSCGRAGCTHTPYGPASASTRVGSFTFCLRLCVHIPRVMCCSTVSLTCFVECLAAVWDLSQVRHAASSLLPCGRDLITENLLYSHLHFRNNFNNHLFDEADEAFEHLFSLLAHVAGLNAGFLPALTFQHVGDVSAYSLNNFTRPWE